MKKARPMVVILVMVMALAAGCAGNPVQENMADFDRAYIPALMMTRDKDTTGESVMAIKQLKLQWTVFSSKNPGMAEEGGAAGNVEDMIKKADTLINVGKYREAHSTLIKVEKQMRQARAEVGIKYFPDRLGDFNDVRVRMIRDWRNPEKVQAHIPDAIAAWQQVQKTRVSSSIFRLSKDNAKRIKYLIKKEGEALMALSAAAASDDNRKMMALLKDVNDRFLRIYSMFGNFQGARL